jgi:hypothetical protein
MDMSSRYTVLKPASGTAEPGADLAKNLRFSLDTHLVHMEDGYVLQVYSVPKPAPGTA